MLEKLIEIATEFAEKLTPVYFVKEYQGGVLFRLGRFKSVIPPGIHWKWPITDDVDIYCVATTTMALPVQSMTTRDGHNVVMKARIKYRVSNLKIYGVEVADVLDALSDMVCGIQFDLIRSMTLVESLETNLDEVITADAKKEARKWGIAIDKVTVTDYSEMRSIRLFNEGSKMTD